MKVVTSTDLQSHEDRPGVGVPFDDFDRISRQCRDMGRKGKLAYRHGVDS